MNGSRPIWTVSRPPWPLTQKNSIHTPLERHKKKRAIERRLRSRPAVAWACCPRRSTSGARWSWRRPPRPARTAREGPSRQRPGERETRPVREAGIGNSGGPTRADSQGQGVLVCGLTVPFALSIRKPKAKVAQARGTRNWKTGRQLRVQQTQSQQPEKHPHLWVELRV